MTYVVTHRGIDFENKHSFTESSREAFEYFLNKGFGIEFDIQITKDLVPVISHDENISRISEKKDSLPISEITIDEFLKAKLPNGHTLSLVDIIEMIKSADKSIKRLHALHLKSHNQTNDQLNILLPFLKDIQGLPVIVFDVKPEIVRLLKKLVPGLVFAISVAHTYDIDRYGKSVGNTLFSISDAIKYKQLYTWAWCDEWDRSDSNGSEKNFYSNKNFDTLRNNGYKLAIVSPELHATSPKLLGGEQHPVGRSLESIVSFWNEIRAQEPDAICTDYPDICGKIIL
ncbi:MAG: glycerophosphoryl diester phosphodiesterase [Patescibacteria group bacterium]|nr:glycerophosphoryl diester phosphodiesterase [Patescibacteria group bacterium]MDQ5981514.1 glycerophosphoryl diester phosphodiesterase [Patescibacteria group bacterium]